MVQIQWGLAQGPNSFENALAKGYQLGSAMRERQEATERKNALAAYATDPNEQNFAGLAQAAPEFAMQERQRRAAAATQQADQRRADLPIALRLLETATDEASYQRNLAIARDYNIDTSRFPTNFDPQWREQNLATMKLLTSPEGQQILSQAGKQAFDEGLRPGTDGRFEARVKALTDAGLVKTFTVEPGGYAGEYNPITGNSRYIVAPGGQAPMDIPADAIEALKRGEGTPEQFDQMFGPGAAARVMGGGAGNSTGNFR